MDEQRGPDWTFGGYHQGEPVWLADRRHKNVRVNELVRKCVLFLGILDDTGAFAPYGTGFLVGYKHADFYFKYLVTCKHVIDDMQASKRPMVARLNRKLGIAQTGQVPPEHWRFHPTQKNCDIAVASFNASFDLFDLKHTSLADALTPEYIAANDIGPGDEVFTVGLLVNHFGLAKNIPVVRMGNIATMPEEAVYLGTALEHQEVYLIESRSIGGLSGSPVYLHTQTHRVLNDEIKEMVGHQQEYLMGVNIGLFETKAHGDTIPVETADRRERFLETMGAGIAVVVPIQRAIEIIEDQEFTNIRERWVKEHGEKTGFKPTSVSTVAPAVGDPPATDANPNHREDFTRLLGAAVKTPAPKD